MSDNVNVGPEMEEEAQPSGLEIQKTIQVINEILTNPEFCNEVRVYHGWPADMSSDRVALVFLTGRFQWAVDLLSRQTRTLKQEVEALERRIVSLEDVNFGNMGQHFRE